MSTKNHFGLLMTSIVPVYESIIIFCEDTTDLPVSAAAMAVALEKRQRSRCALVNPSYQKLDPVGSTVRYEMMKLCTGSA